MAIAVEEHVYTPEDLLTLPDMKGFELVEGRLVEKGMGAESSWAAVLLTRQISQFVLDHDLGWVFDSECGYQCYSWNPRQVRKPDVSFILRGRLTPDRPPKGHIRIAPDLAIEVVSPNDLYSEVRAKVREYVRAGVRLVWVLDPGSRSAEVFRADRTSLPLTETDTLDGEDVLPGFRCLLSDVLPAIEDAEPEEAI